MVQEPNAQEHGQRQQPPETRPCPQPSATTAQAAPAPRRQRSREASPTERRVWHTEYLSIDKVQKALEAGEALVGAIRVMPQNRAEYRAYVTVQGIKQDLLIMSEGLGNRAMTGDRVVVVVNPLADWFMDVSDKGKTYIDGAKRLLQKEELDHRQLVSLAQKMPEMTHKAVTLKYATCRVVAVMDSLFNPHQAGHVVLGWDNGDPCVIFEPIRPNVRKARLPVFSVERDKHFWDTPYDPSAPSKCQELRLPDLYEVDYVAWAAGQHLPEADNLRLLGDGRDAQIFWRAAALSFDLGCSQENVEPFPSPYRGGARKFSTPDIRRFALPDAEITENSQRMIKEFDKKRIFTIDEAGTMSMDDALSVKKRADGTIEVGVHITDVTDVIKAGSELDNTAMKNFQSVWAEPKCCLGEIVPAEERMKCSFTPDADRPAFSFMFVFNAKGDLVKCDVYRSVVRSCCSMSFMEADNLALNPASLDKGRVSAPFTREQISDDIKTLMSLNNALQEARRKRGGDLDVYNTKSSLFLSELMVLVDHQAALLICKHFKQGAVLFGRMEAGPVDAAKAAKSHVDFYYNETPADARKGHSKSGFDRFARVTSPMRRYMDIVTQRQLVAAIMAGELEEISADERTEEEEEQLQSLLSTYNSENVSEICFLANAYVAKVAELKSFINQVNDTKQ